VVAITPDRGEEQLLTAPVTIVFDQPMDPASTASAFSIEPAVPGQVKVEGNRLIFSPTERLKRGAEYRVNLAQTATSAAGQPLPYPVSFRFNTVGFLEVTGTQPARGATEVSVDTSITVAFNRPVVPLTGVAEQASLPQPLSITPTVAGTGQWINTGIYQFTPSTRLAASTLYTVTVKAGLEDTTGGLLTEDYVFTFRTADPYVLSWLPADNVNVPVESPITVTFSMPMERTSTEAAFSLVDNNQQPVAGIFTWAEGDTVLGFKPTRSLEFGTRYTAKVHHTARPASGEGSLRESADYSFTTVSLPKVTGTDPRNGSQAADPYWGVTFYFASPMDPASFVTGTVTVVPEPAQLKIEYNEWDHDLYVGFDKLPATAYTVTLSGKVADPYGNLLGEDYVLRFTTRDYDPLLQLTGPGQIGTYNAYTATRAAVVYRNVPEITFSLYRVPDEDLIALTGREWWRAWDAYRPRDANLVHKWSVSTDAERNRTAVMFVELLDAEGQQLPPGAYFLQLQGKDIKQRPYE